MEKISTLTGVRAMAALWVFYFHLIKEKSFFLDFTYFIPLVKKGALGVDLFFILSGLVISYVYQSQFATFDSKKALNFLSLRIARIFPVHWFMLFACLVAFLVSVRLTGHFPEHADRYSLLSFVYNLFNVHAWGVLRDYTWNFPSWSVSAEWFAYLTFPFTAPFFIRLDKMYANVLVILLCLLVLFNFNTYVVATSPWYGLHFLVQILTEFSIGCCLFNLFKMQQGLSLQHKKAWDYVALGCIGLVIAMASFKVHSILIICVFPLLLLALSLANGWSQRFFGSRVMVHLGEISYSFYMVHGFINAIYEFILKKFPQIHLLPSALIILVLLSVVVLAAQGLYLLVEKPARGALKDWFKQHLDKRPIRLGSLVSNG